MDSHDGYSDEQIRKILSYRNIAVVGISRDPHKAAHYVPAYLADNGYDITPVNPSADTILGRKCHADMDSIEHDMDIVQIFRPSDQVASIVAQAVKKRPKAIWLQLGIYDAEAERIAAQAGIPMVYDRCMLVEHRRLAR